MTIKDYYKITLNALASEEKNLLNEIQILEENIKNAQMKISDAKENFRKLKYLESKLNHLKELQDESDKF